MVAELEGSRILGRCMVGGKSIRESHIDRCCSKDRARREEHPSLENNSENSSCIDNILENPLRAFMKSYTKSAGTPRVVERVAWDTSYMWYTSREPWERPWFPRFPLQNTIQYVPESLSGRHGHVRDAYISQKTLAAPGLGVALTQQYATGRK